MDGITYFFVILGAACLSINIMRFVDYIDRPRTRK